MLLLSQYKEYNSKGMTSDDEITIKSLQYNVSLLDMLLIVDNRFNLDILDDMLEHTFTK